MVVRTIESVARDHGLTHMAVSRPTCSGRYPSANGFVNCDLTINLLRRPQGERICVDARTLLAPNGCGLAESQLVDESGLIGRATQSLAAQRRRRVSCTGP